MVIKMSNRDGHIGKTIDEKRNYHRYLKDAPYSPTSNETLQFPASDHADQDLSEPTSTTHRRGSFQEKVREHIVNNYIEWFLAIALFVLFYFAIDSKIDFARLDTKVISMGENITNNKEDTKQIQKSIHSLDLKIQENRLTIENVKELIGIKKKK